jgi:hypothetical protein
MGYRKIKLFIRKEKCAIKSHGNIAAVVNCGVIVYTHNGAGIAIMGLELPASSGAHPGLVSCVVIDHAKDD